MIAQLAGGDDEKSVDIVVAGPDAAAEASRIEPLGTSVGIRFTVTTASDDDTATAAVRADEADVAVLTDGAALATEDPVDLSDDSTLATTLNVLRADIALEHGLEAVGLEADQAAEVRATDPPPVESLQPSDSGADTSRSGVAIVTNILLFLMLQTYGSWVLTAVTREKASRVIEVLLAVIRPKQLLIGKTIGIGLVALGHAAVLIAVAFVTTRIVGLDITGGLRAGDLLVGAVWFLLGYALYCSVFAAAGALCARVEDAQAYAFPVMIPLLFVVHRLVLGRQRRQHAALGPRLLPPDSGARDADALRHRGGAAVGRRAQHGDHRRRGGRRGEPGGEDLRALRPTHVPARRVARGVPGPPGDRNGGIRVWLRLTGGYPCPKTHPRRG